MFTPGVTAETRDLFRRFEQAASEPGTNCWNAVLRTVGGKPVEGKGSNVFRELARLGYAVAPTPRPGDIALFVEEVSLDDGRLSNVRHAAFVAGVGSETTFLSTGLTRSTMTSQEQEAPGEYSLAAMTAQDPGLARARVLYLRPTHGEGTRPARTVLTDFSQ